MIVFFSRNGKPLGSLNQKVNGIQLMTSSEFKLSKEDLKRMEKGEFIAKPAADKPEPAPKEDAE